MRKSFCDTKDSIFGCKYCKKVYNLTTGKLLHHGCYFLPYWGKNIDDIRECPRFTWDGKENKPTLRSVCKVSG